MIGTRPLRCLRNTARFVVGAFALLAAELVSAQPAFPPTLPGGLSVVRDTSPRFLSAPDAIRSDVDVATTPPTVDFLYLPQQTCPGNPWSVWGDGLAVGDLYFTSIGDHRGPEGNAFVFEYDAAKRSIRTLVDLRATLKLPAGHYTPGKIHGRLDLGVDGWLYFSTHRGSTRVTNDRYHYRGDWILRHRPSTGRTEVVAHAPVGKQCIPASVLDSQRRIFYGGTAAGDFADKRVLFFAWDVGRRELLYSGYDGPSRYLILARSGKVYWVGNESGKLRRWDPDTGGEPVALAGEIGLRAATRESPQGVVYTVSRDGQLYAFDARSERVRALGSAVVGTQSYITSIDVDPTGRWLYYTPGAHGGGERDGAPVVQFDVTTRRKKIIAFLHPFYRDAYGYTPLGTFGSAVGPRGERVFITWNGNRGGPDRRGRLQFDTCALTVIHVPTVERGAAEIDEAHRRTAPTPSRPPLEFRDVWPTLEPTQFQRGMMGHAAAWGDVDGDGRVDLFVGTFADRPAAVYREGGAAGPVPNHLFLNRGDRFVPAGSETVAWHGRASGCVLADLDNDGDADLYVTNNGRLGAANRLWRNDGGRFTDVTDRAGAPISEPEFARSATAADFDGDGVLDLVVVATVGKSETRFFRGRGDLRYEASNAIPGDACGLGVAAADLTDDTWPDLLVAGSNRLFVNRGDGSFREAEEFGFREQLVAEDRARSCGVAIGDFDRDGHQDIVIGHHTKRPWAEPVAVRLLRNAGSTRARVRFDDVTERVGIGAIPMRAPHVELRDFDNDGWPDVWASAATFRDGRIHPAIWRSTGATRGRLPRFEDTAFVHRRDFPDADDYRAGERTASFYERLVAKRKAMYWAPGPSADFDGDGRLDLYLASWWSKLPSFLLRNETRVDRTHHWLAVRVTATRRGANRSGIGSVVRAYRVGEAGDARALLASEAIATAEGYTSARPAIAHLGLAGHARCDIVVTLPCGKGKVVRSDVAVDRVLEVVVD